MMPTAAVKNLQTAGFRGDAIPRKALEALLQGTGLTYGVTGPRSIAVYPQRRPGLDAHAQAIDLPAIDVEGANDSIVAFSSSTATKTDTPLIETPQTINVVTREEIVERGAQTLDQVLRYTPGVSTQSEGGTEGRRDTIFSRGFVASQYLDGLPVNGTNFGYGVTQIDPYRLERVEVLKGPASVLYGRNEPGGLVNMVSKLPTAQPMREVQIQGGTFDRLQGAFDLSGPFDKDGQYLYRLIGLARNSGTQVDHVPDDRFFIAPAVTWKPSNDTSLTVLGSFQKDNALGFQQAPLLGAYSRNPLGYIPRSRFFGEPGFDHYRREQYSVGYIFNHRFNNNVSFRQSVRYDRTDDDLAFTNALDLKKDMRTLERYATVYHSKTTSMSADQSFLMNFGTGPFQHKALIGLDFNQTTLVDRGTSSFDENGHTTFPSIDIFNPIYGRPYILQPESPGEDAVQRQIGVYAQDQIKFDRWVLTLGLRQDWAKLSSQYGGPAEPTKRASDEKLTGRIGLGYLFDNGIAPYVSYATSFQPVLGRDRERRPFQPTTGEQYEAGIKYQPASYDAFVTLSAFDLTQQNVLTEDPLNPFKSVQTGEVRVRGVEVEGKAKLRNGIELIASYAYLDGEITKTNITGEKGNDPSFTPRHQASLWANYIFQSGMPLWGLEIGAGVRYTGRQYSATSNTYPLKSTTIFDAAVRYDFGAASPQLKGYSLEINTMNLFDLRYVTAANYSAQFGQARTVLATLKYRW